MPKWPNPGYTNCMRGTHSDAIIADAYVKGVRGFDEKKAAEAAKIDGVSNELETLKGALSESTKQMASLQAELEELRAMKPKRQSKVVETPTEEDPEE